MSSWFQFSLGVFWLGLFVFGWAPGASAQNVSVQSASVSSLELVPGGDAVRLTLSGAGLNQVTGITVLNRRRPVADVTVRLGRKSATRLAASITAGASAAVGQNYLLSLVAGRTTFNVPPRILTVSVTAPEPIHDLELSEIETEWNLLSTRAELDVTAVNVGTARTGGRILCDLAGNNMPVENNMLTIEPGERVARTAGYPLPDLWRDFSEGQSVRANCVVETFQTDQTDLNGSNDTASVNVQVPRTPMPDLTLSVSGHSCEGLGTPTDDAPLCVRVGFASNNGWVIDPFVVTCTLNRQSRSRELDEAYAYGGTMFHLDFGVQEAGRHSVSCTIDEGNAVRETNEGNNTETAVIVVERARRR